MQHKQYIVNTKMGYRLLISLWLGLIRSEAKVVCEKPLHLIKYPEQQRHTDLAKVAVAIDIFFLMTVLEFVIFDIEPQGLHYAGTSLGMDTKQASQTRI